MHADSFPGLSRWCQEWSGYSLSLPWTCGPLVPGLDFCFTLDCFTHALCPSSGCPSQESETCSEDKLMSVALQLADFQVLPRMYPVRAAMPSALKIPLLSAPPARWPWERSLLSAHCPQPSFAPGRQSKLGLDSYLHRGPRRDRHASGSSPDGGKIRRGSNQQVTSLALEMPGATPSRLGSVSGTAGPWQEEVRATWQLCRGICSCCDMALGSGHMPTAGDCVTSPHCPFLVTGPCGQPLSNQSCPP